MNNQPRRSRSYGFTLVELLVVIGIIAVLISLLLPALINGRNKAKIADTQQEFSILTAAIGQYEGVFNAYPGPFSNDQVDRPKNTGYVGITESPNLNIPPQIFTPSTNSYGPPIAPMPSGPWLVSGAENLALGLLGGLRLNPLAVNGNYYLAYAPGDVGTGPMSLNPLNPKRFPSFIQMSSGTTSIVYVKTAQGPSGAVGDVLNGTFTPDPNGGRYSDGTNIANDTPFPKFVDKFTPAMPILYLRARTGAPGIVSNASVTTPLAPWSPCQYDLAEVTSYTGQAFFPTGGHIGGVGAEKIATPSHGLAPSTFDTSGVGNPITISSTSAPYLPFPVMDPAHPESPNNGGANGAAYFMNASVAPTDFTNFQSGKSRAVDEWMLISAGPDGIYGTADDIVSFGNVMQ